MGGYICRGRPSNEKPSGTATSRHDLPNPNLFLQPRLYLSTQPAGRKPVSFCGQHVIDWVIRYGNRTGQVEAPGTVPIHPSIPLCKFMPRISVPGLLRSLGIRMRRLRPALGTDTAREPGKAQPVCPAVIGGDGRTDWDNSEAQQSPAIVHDHGNAAPLSWPAVFSGVYWHGERAGLPGTRWLVWRGSCFLRKIHCWQPEKRRSTRAEVITFCVA